MAARTFTSAGVNNLWSNPANWDGGVAVPVNNDSVTIPSGQTCEFDVDQSGFADGIDGLTITGTLSLTRTAGTYYLKIKAAKTINGAGTFDCGTSVSPIPFAAKHTITGGTGWYIKGNDGVGMTMTVYAAEPVIKYVRLTGAESVGATVLEVDTDITGDIWADGDNIRIINIAGGQDAETRTIAAGGIASGSITITAGITNAKIQGAYIALINRNVNFISANAYLLRSFQSEKLTIGGGSFTGNRSIVWQCLNTTISGGAFSVTSDYAIYSGTCTITGGSFISSGTYGMSTTANISGGFFGGSYYMIGTLINCTISGGTFAGCFTVFLYAGGVDICGGYFVGSTYIFQASTGITISGGIFESNSQVVHSSNAVITGGQFIANTYLLLAAQARISNITTSSGSTYDINQSVFSAYNCIFAAATENRFYQNLSKYSYSESIDHDQVAGAYKAWTTGGITTTQASVLPTGYTKAYITVLENATVEGYWQREITVGAGASVNIETQLRKDASMTYLPRAIIFNKASTDPFAGGAGLHTFTMTDSVNTWESDLYTYTNSGTEDVTLVIRIQGMNATGNLYSALDVEQINVDLTSAIAKIDAIKAKTDQLAFTVANQVDSNSLTGAGTPADVVTALMAEVVEGTYTFKEILHIMTAVLAGKSSGGATANVKFRDLGDTKDRIDANVDANGNRLSVTLDGT